MLLLSLLACTEQTVRVINEVPVAEPPGEESDDFGSPPQWADCTEGYAGQYYNLPTTGSPSSMKSRLRDVLRAAPRGLGEARRVHEVEPGVDFRRRSKHRRALRLPLIHEQVSHRRSGRLSARSRILKRLARLHPSPVLFARRDVRGGEVHDAGEITDLLGTLGGAVALRELRQRRPRG